VHSIIGCHEILAPRRVDRVEDMIKLDLVIPVNFWRTALLMAVEARSTA
jgi:hypothetical protein